MSESMRECCGLFGVYDADSAIEKTYIGLMSLQHRGEESAGVACTDGRRMDGHVGMGLVPDVFNQNTVDRFKPFRSAIGHVRYSTLGSSTIKNAQPLLINLRGKPIAVALNGQITNAATLRKEYEDKGSIFTTSTDTEVILHVLADPRHASLQDAFEHSLCHLEGSFCLLFLTPKEMIAVRDPHGFKPLCLGQQGNTWAVSSESCAFDHAGFRFTREVEPGEIVKINRFGLDARRFAPKECPRSHCIFELIYFARDDSYIFGRSVYSYRKALGRALALESGVEAEMVMSVPSGGDSAALGYHEESGIPLEHGFVRNRYIGRTFIRPADLERAKLADLKLNAVSDVIKGKRVVVVDDSIVRGTTSRSRIGLIKQAGAKEVHVRITCPPLKHTCHYGIDMQQDEDLIAAQYDPRQIERFLAVDSLHYLEFDSMLDCLGDARNDFCVACFKGNYPVKLRDKVCKEQLG
ncbi:MAG TPA: amidophosphoribosyltransferase [Candidatus Brocadiia bacterium]|nr:amidophosphoribosyltransferase [Candidatus Brocadiia bacterium]